MELALLGQFSVILFRLVTGHVGGGVMGLVVFVVGNQARCSLQNSTLTTYVVLGMTTGLLDLYSLLTNLLIYGPGFFALPVEPNLSRDIEAISLILAPISEILGAQMAWDSYLTPELLMLRPDAGDMCYSMPRPWTMHHMSPSAGLGMRPLQWPPQRGESWFPWLESAQSSAPWQTSSSSQAQHAWRGYGGYTAPRARRSSAGTGGDHDGYTAGSGEPMQEDSSFCDNQQCDECGREVEAIWTGTGSYNNHVYCNECWNSWTSSMG